MALSSAVNQSSSELFVAAITPTTRNWTSKVTVIEKSPACESRDRATRYQRFLLIDSKSTKVPLTIFNEDIEMFTDRLQLFKTYLISNATVKPANIKYQIDNHPYQWSLRPQCIIEEVPESGTTHVNKFISVDSFENPEFSSSAIDVMVIVLRMLQMRPVQTSNGPAKLQDFVVIDKSMRPVILTFWDKFFKSAVADLASCIDHKPILIGLGLRLNSYNGLSFVSRSTSSFVINPSIPSAVDLRAWASDHMDAINALRNSSDLVTVAQAFGRQNLGEVKTLQHVKHHPPIDDFHVKARLRITNYAQNFIRGICSLCKKPTSAVYHKTYVCNHCNKQAISLPKFRMEVEISDRTDSIIATMSETAAEYFLGCKIDMLVQRLMERESFQSIVQPKCNIDMNIQLRRFENSRRGTITESFYILKLKRADNNEISEGIVDNVYMHEWLHDLEDVELTVKEKRVLQKLAQRKKPRLEVSSQVSSSIVCSSDTNIDRCKTADSTNAPASSSTQGIGTQE